MAHLNWHRYCLQFHHLATELTEDQYSDPACLTADLHQICMDDPACDELILGVESFRIAFLEYLFAQAEGPFSGKFPEYARAIRTLVDSSEPLQHLLSFNAPDAIGNMVLNKRGRLKFLIADHLELMMLLEWWPRLGLEPVTEREVLDAILKKPYIQHRLTSGDPGLLLRLLEVFPTYQKEFWKQQESREDLSARLATLTPPPSYRRYHRLYTSFLKEGTDLREIIRQEEERILPLQQSRNTFLAYLVRKFHNDTCQVCKVCGTGHEDRDITVHHIIPLSRGGEDRAWNMLVVCRSHHHAIHESHIHVSVDDTIHIRCDSRTYHINPAFSRPSFPSLPEPGSV